MMAAIVGAMLGVFGIMVVFFLVGRQALQMALTVSPRSDGSRQEAKIHTAERTIAVLNAEQPGQRRVVEGEP